MLFHAKFPIDSCLSSEVLVWSLCTLDAWPSTRHQLEGAQAEHARLGGKMTQATAETDLVSQKKRDMLCNWPTSRAEHDYA